GLVVLAALMVWAMVTWCVALMTRPRPRRRSIAGLDDLRARLRALDPANQAGARLVWLSEICVRPEWEVVPPDWFVRYARVKLNCVYGARMLLIEPDHEIRYWESIRSASVFVGFEGWRPRFTWPLYYVGGPLEAQWRGRAFGLHAG